MNRPNSNPDLRGELFVQTSKGLVRGIDIGFGAIVDDEFVWLVEFDRHPDDLVVKYFKFTYEGDGGYGA